MSVYSNSVISPHQFSTLVELLIYRAKNQSEQKAYTFLQSIETEAASLTYKELHVQAQAIAASLQALNLGGERALLLYQPGLDFIAAFFGCLYAGVIAVPAYPPRRNQKLSRLQAIAADAQAKIVLTSKSILDNLQTSSNQEDLEISGLHWLATDELSNDLAQAWQPQELTGDTLAFLQYTSGSTGTPKGVMISHGNLLHNERMIEKAFGHTNKTIVVGWLPVFHDMGLIGNVLQPLYLGVPCILMSPVEFLQKPIRWLQAISHYKATTSGGPNFAYDLCIRKVTPEQLATLDLSSWEVAFTGAEPVRAETLEQFASTFAPCGFRKEAFYPCYGMAETTLIVSGGEKTALPITCNVDKAALEQNRIVKQHKSQGDIQTIVGCGQSPSDQKVIIVDPQSLTICAPEQVGEIWVAGPSVAQGYWNQPEETEKAFRAYLADTDISDAETSIPFFRTGDLGFLQDGELFITGRLKDVIIIRGQNHYPQDIELTVEKSHPALKPASGAAFSVDFKGSERLVIVQEVERSYLRKLNVQEILGNVRQAVIAQHGLDIFATVLIKTGSIPKTSSGKIRRQACRTAFLAGTLDVMEDWSENPQNKAKFKDLEAEVDSVLRQLTPTNQL
ncbi:AMP-dependent synthetase and ligase [Nostoc commune NIES-4072]|uniref:AMP-dependent synthetase and ligase n=1 Tax=Nostoc commune NIES-4072 TaxID=2005467 RepID=A0A2R5FQU2_NOSCO|nr:fatty acyl-AMP ligase [Nostoc commune]BBD69134.1 AMP-dependent synthetase and ligase [Nostoc commune HK-02]GBG19868.1 AMP-dependent synthetase and ligase [Nostoc commune NIES-4072]